MLYCSKNEVLKITGDKKYMSQTNRIYNFKQGDTSKEVLPHPVYACAFLRAMNFWSTCYWSTLIRPLTNWTQRYVGIFISDLSLDLENASENSIAALSCVATYYYYCSPISKYYPWLTKIRDRHLNWDICFIYCYTISKYFHWFTKPM